MTSLDRTPITRLFADLTDEEVSDAESTISHWRWLGSRGSTWDELLTARRVLIISEAGVGKSYECQLCQEKLWEKGEPAFLLELSPLAGSAVESMLKPEQVARLQSWRVAQSEVATFFLDSVDELKATQQSFEQALIHLAQAVDGHLSRVRLVITTRPTPMDRALVERILPIPAKRESVPTPQEFADIAMKRPSGKKKEEDVKPEWRVVALLPLTIEQVREFAVHRKVTDVDRLIGEIERRNAYEDARRPEDLIELCSDWNEHGSIRRHADQVASGVAVRLKARTDRKERAELSELRSLEGASHLAFAAMATRKFTIRHNAASDHPSHTQPALDASRILLGWSEAERATLLERPMFGFANYGRVRFQSSSAREYLAAKYLDAKLRNGASIASIKRLLFTDTLQAVPVVRPTMRPVAGWLAAWHESVFAEVLKREPEIALLHGDPESLSIPQRARALTEYSNRYGSSGWRGLQVPEIQIGRFASENLGPAIRSIWTKGIANPELRELLLALIGAGQVADCAELAYGALMDTQARHSERLEALNALINLKDSRLPAVAASIIKGGDLWPEPLARGAAAALFPGHLGGTQVSEMLAWSVDTEDGVGGLVWRLAQIFKETKIEIEEVEALREGLTELIAQNSDWDAERWPHVFTRRSDLVELLVVVCNRVFDVGVGSVALNRSAAIAIRFSRDDYRDTSSSTELRKHIARLRSDERFTTFLALDAFLSSVHTEKDAWNRYFAISQDGGMTFSATDAEWVEQRLADPSVSAEDRKLMLIIALNDVAPSGPDHLAYLEKLKLMVADDARVAQFLEACMTPSEISEEAKRHLAKQEQASLERKKNQEEAHASWVKFWQEIVESPEKVFEESEAFDTAWNLWRAMKNFGEGGRSAGWNRNFIEKRFGRTTADRLRETLMGAWRKDTPSFKSERPPEKKNETLVRWQLGLAAIYAEAEDRNWAKHLTPQEVKIALRLIPIDFDRFPPWLDALIEHHPAIVDAELGKEMSLSFDDPTEDSDAAFFLQNARSSSERVIAALVPRILGWVQSVEDNDLGAGDRRVIRLGQANDVLFKSKDPRVRVALEAIATRHVEREEPSHQTFALWVAVLLDLNPQLGVDLLEKKLEGVAVSTVGVGAALVAALFDSSRRSRGAGIRSPGFTPHLVLRLVRLAYAHVRPEHDNPLRRVGTSDQRDHAEHGRGMLLNAFLEMEGAEAWDAKQQMIADPRFGSFKDRVAAVALEKAAREVDGCALLEADVVSFDKCREFAPRTRDEIYALMCDRLDDLDDHLVQDTSPRELWSTIKTETLMRRAIAGELESRANGMYSASQEGVTGDEKETDIRLISTGSSQEAVIELKIGDKERSANELVDAIKNQLVGKYLKPAERRAGCLLITLAKSRTWLHPASGAMLGFPELIAYLNSEAAELALSLGGSIRLSVKGLDLRGSTPAKSPRQLRRRKSNRLFKESKNAAQSKALRKKRPQVRARRPK